MKHSLILAGIVLAAAAVAGCSEHTQTIGTGIRSDTAAFQGPGTPFTAAGWKQGDKTSWEQELKTRAQNGQNEYNKTN